MDDGYDSVAIAASPTKNKVQSSTDLGAVDLEHADTEDASARKSTYNAPVTPTKGSKKAVSKSKVRAIAETPTKVASGAKTIKAEKYVWDS